MKPHQKRHAKPQFQMRFLCKSINQFLSQTPGTQAKICIFMLMKSQPIIVGNNFLLASQNFNFNFQASD
jgi:hypothetical protein